jgi:hypothetical protein
MTKWLVLLAAAASIAALAPTTTSLAQGIAVEVPGVGVRIGEPPRRDRERVLEERDVRGGPPKCRTVTVTVDTPFGSRSRTRQECD